MAHSIRALLRQDGVIWVYCLGQICDPKLVEIVGYEGGYHAVWLDQEHAGVSIGQIEQATRAARGVGLDTFVRLAPTDYATVMRSLEAGAGGIMAAQVRNAAQAEEVVRWCKFHPQGLRGVNGSGVDGRYGTTPIRDYFAQANERTFVAIQIEHADAVADVENIAALAHVDVLFIGPADLGQSMGIVGDWNHAEVWKAIERVAAACKKNNIHWAILPPTPEYAQRCIALGCKMLSIGIDTWTFQRGLRSFKADFGVR